MRSLFSNLQPSVSTLRVSTWKLRGFPWIDVDGISLNQKQLLLFGADAICLMNWIENLLQNYVTTSWDNIHPDKALSNEN